MRGSYNIVDWQEVLPELIKVEFVIIYILRRVIGGREVSMKAYFVKIDKCFDMF